MSETEVLIKLLEGIRQDLADSRIEAERGGAMAREMGGEWEQEISEDVYALAVDLENMVAELDTVIEEAKTLQEDTTIEERIIRIKGGETETVVDESIQEDIKEHEWREERKKRK
jgi:hypothetical protein